MTGRLSDEAAASKNIELGDVAIRVLVKDKALALTLNAREEIRIFDTASGLLLYQGMGPVKVASTDRHFLINGRDSRIDSCRITTRGKTISVDGRNYRGVLIISKRLQGLSVVNHVPLEHYLYGVVPAEMPYTWAREALMAQAVAARTYALFVGSKNSGKAYDLEMTTRSQAYGGYDAEVPEVNMVVDATRGEIMTYEGRPIIAYFHADSGGFTEDAKNVWGVDLPYLKSIPDRFSSDTPESGWECFFTYHDVRSQLNQTGLKIGPITGVDFSERSSTGRITKVRVYSDQEVVDLTGNNFRIALGEKKLRSTLFEMISQLGGLRMRGKGYGHGVGMSQWGAYRMAQAGFTYRDILKFYYRDIRIVTFAALKRGNSA
jgi:stage II sporulation protein D